MQTPDLHQGLTNKTQPVDLGNPVVELSTAGSDQIVVYGAREHNLKNVTISIPRNKLVVVTGVSGSGKSTLVFDILFAEGQRRFLDLMNTYARQYVEQLPKPDVDFVDGLPPTVSIEQRDRAGGGKSTVATVTEVYHFIRLLFARLGVIYCPRCEVPVEPQTPTEARAQVLAKLHEKEKLVLLAPIVRGRKGFHSAVASYAKSHGYFYVRADGRLYPSDEPLRLERHRTHNVEIVTGTLVLNDRKKVQIVDSPHLKGGLEELVRQTLALGKGTMFVMDPSGEISVLSTERVCSICQEAFDQLDPRHFSYNSPAGWCPKCRGFGEIFWVPEGVDRGAREEEIEETWYEWMEGERQVCPECNGTRLNPLARSVRLPVILPESLLRQLLDRQLVTYHQGSPAVTISMISAMDIATALEFFTAVKFSGRAAIIAKDVIPEIRSRLEFLVEVGLDYLQLARGVPTLSGGELQRIRLAAQLGSNLSGVLYILDEPTIGLHPRDNQKLLNALKSLKRRGNSVVVVEHDPATIKAADFIIELGPGAGVHGGQLVKACTLKELLQSNDSVTAQCLRKKVCYPTRGSRRPVHLTDKTASETPDWLILHNANKHNLKNLTVRFPLGRFIVVTGVSGSGKSTLLRECLIPTVRATLKGEAKKWRQETGMWVSGCENIRAVHEVDQSPIGRTPRSIPATYVGFFDEIRRLFASLPESRMHGYGPGRFSFNSSVGRCPVCLGAGMVKIEMSFMPPAFVVCSTCGGKRFKLETLQVKYRGKSIADVLEMSVEEALEFFQHVPAIHLPLKVLFDTGLGYLKLGQPSPTLSGGEAQRIKLVAYLVSGLKESQDIHRQRKRNLFLLEEPTTGLHMADVQKLVEVIQQLVDFGHTVIVIEHNLELIAEADWVIDLGPEGGKKGGEIVAQGTPEQVAQNKNSFTGWFLRTILKK